MVGGGWLCRSFIVAEASCEVTQGRSVTAIAAYEGQSGSKDRGDPEVRLASLMTLQRLHSYIDV